MAIVARAAVAVGFQERGALAPEQRHVRFGRRRGDVEVAGQHRLHARRRHFRIAGELVEQATQDHGIGMGDRVLDHRVVRCPQFRPGRRGRRCHPRWSSVSWCLKPPDFRGLATLSQVERTGGGTKQTRPRGSVRASEQASGDG